MSETKEIAPIGAHQRKQVTTPDEKKLNQESTIEESTTQTLAATPASSQSTATPTSASSSRSIRTPIKRKVKRSFLRRGPPSITTVLFLFIAGYAAHAAKMIYVPWIFFLAAMLALLLQKLDAWVQKMEAKIEREREAACEAEQQQSQQRIKREESSTDSSSTQTTSTQPINDSAKKGD